MSVADERSNRGRRLWRGIGSSVFSRVLAVVAPLVTIPIAFHYLGANAYGAWSAALSLTAFAGFADLGLGAGLMTKLAAALSVQAFDEARELVSTAYAILTAVAGTFVAALWFSSFWVDYGKLVGSESGSDSVSAIVLVTVTLFLLNVILSLIVRVQYAAQQIALSNIWQGGGSIAGIVATFAIALTSVGPEGFIAVAAGAPLLIAAVNSVLFFSSGTGRKYSPDVFHIRLSAARPLLYLGGGFLAINILIAISTATDSLIVANTIGLETVPEYAIPARVFSVMAVATAVLAGPLWPINVEALRRGDIAWVRTTTKRMAGLAGSTSLVMGIVGIVAGPYLISLWLGGAFQPSMILLAGLALALFVQSVTSPYFMVQNAAAVLSPQIIGYALLTLTFPIKWIVALTVGYEFIPFITAAGFLVFLWPAVLVGYRRAIRSPVNGTAVVVEVEGG